MRQICWQKGSVRTCPRWLRFLLVASSVLSGCTDKMCPDTANADVTVYDKCLARHESVTGAAQVGPFTSLAIRYSESYGYFGGHQTYQRILYKGQTLVRKVDDVQPWHGLSNTVLFADFFEGDLSAGRLHLIYESAGQPIVERIDAAKGGWDGSHEFPYGYSLYPSVRYFPKYVGGRDAGFLLQVFPTRAIKLPLGPQGMRAPWVQSLAGIAPDGKAYAYTDSRMTPSAVVVVDADGTVHDPVPIPFTSLARSENPADNPFDPVWRWFATTFTWQKDGRGRWGIVPSWSRTAIPSANPVEELFIDAARGYLTCFVSTDPGCVRGWQFDRESTAHLGECCLSPYVYAPSSPTRAFEADVVALVHSESPTSGTGYQLLLNAPPDHVIESLSNRLKGRIVPFVRADQCSNVPPHDDACMVLLKQTIQWKDPMAPGLLGQILSAAEHGAIFMTPTVALAVYAAPNGKTWVDTLARYDLSVPGANTKLKPGYISEVYHSN